MYRLKLVLKYCVISSLFLVEFELKINSIYKILLVIMDYFITFRNFLEFIVFFFHVINKEFTIFIVSE